MMSEQQLQNDDSKLQTEDNGLEHQAGSPKAAIASEVLLHPPLAEFLQQQSVPVEGQEHVRCSPRVKDGKFMTTVFDGVNTIHDMFIHGYNISKEKNCAGWRPGPEEPYKWFTYQDVYDKVRRVGSGLICRGAKTDTSQFVGIYSQNNVEWLVMDRVCAGYSMVSVPLYDTLGPEALMHILHQCELEIIMVDTNERAQKLLGYLKDGKVSSIRLLLMVNKPDALTKDMSAETGGQLMTMEELEEEGGKSLKEFVPPKPDDLYTISYTSGTTGTPKGAMHTHLNGVSMSCAFLVNGEDYNREMNPSDILISYLPLAHVFERYTESGVLMRGASIGFYQGDPKLLMNDAAALKPTIFPLVPRLINRIYGKIMAAVGQSGLKKFLFDVCLGRKMAALKQGRVSNDTIWDKLVLHKFQAALGGRVKLSVTAAAPISPNVLNVVRCVLGIPILEAYGQTECTCAVTSTLYGDYEGGNVGSILPTVYIKLVDVPEKEYYAKDDKGEICCKGISIFKGYYKDEAKTKEALDEDGWLHTGDIGQWLPNGSLKIIDRRKNIFKLSQGEYIAPEKIEQIYTMSSAVHQVYVHGNTLKSCLIAVVVPEEETFSSWCKEKGIDVNEKSFSELCGMQEVNQLVLEDVNKLGKSHGLKTFELIKKLHLSPEPFTIQNNLMTPTLKTRRPQVEQRYREELDGMYAGLD